MLVKLISRLLPGTYHKIRAIKLAELDQLRVIGYLKGLEQSKTVFTKLLAQVCECDVERRCTPCLVLDNFNSEHRKEKAAAK